MNEMNRDMKTLRTWLALLRASNTIKKDIDSKLRAQFGISISRFDILSALQRGNRNGLRSGELSRQLFVSEGNTTQVIGKLIQEGLVLRRNDANDARVVIYSLSDEGEALFRKMADKHRSWIGETFKELSEADLAALQDLLSQLPPLLTSKEKDVA
ncbi:MarR family winged helix-turn-helix transcriptional regulator [Emcibacter sp.]|uniref:MarR family winged helix-turn-helix transcriptional regulator n=1 Tax=Emcibacter sp. TaxID=1979954 RepID=UPI003A9553D5